MKRILLSLLFFGFLLNAEAQELQSQVTIMANRISNQADKKAFQTLQGALTNFINNRKWTNDVYQVQEKIKCNFLITIDQDLGQHLYKSSLVIQAARPVFNSVYESPIINFQDNDITFKYVEFQPVEFSENRVQGNDPEAANLTAVLAYYINIILGMDYDSFAPRGGDVYFQKAQNIVSNAPEAGSITGWKAFDGQRNRFKLVEGLVDSRYNLVHDAIYSYYRKGLDVFAGNDKEAQSGIFNALNYLNTVNQENPRAMVIQFFFQGKSAEIAKALSKATPDIRARAYDMLMKLDLSNANLYKELK